MGQPRIAGPAAEQRIGHRLYRVEVVATLTYDVTAPSIEDAEIKARRCARGVVHHDEISSVVGHSVNLTDSMRTANLNGWLEGEVIAMLTYGQHARMRRGEDMEAEILHAARAELYKAIDAPRWKPIKWSEVKHAETCKSSTGTVLIGPSAGVNTEMEVPTDHRVLEMAKAIENHPWLLRSDVKPEISVRSHHAECMVCKAVVTRGSILVTIPWAGRMLSREYAL